MLAAAPLPRRASTEGLCAWGTLKGNGGHTIIARRDDRAISRDGAGRPLGSPRGVGREQLLAVLGERILSGAYPEGSLLPTEIGLGSEFGVSRTVVREAIKMLAAKGMVETRKRVGTRVLDRRNWNRLDADLIRWASRLPLDPAFAAGLIEARRVIEPAAARLAALHGTEDDLAAIAAAFAAMEEAPAGDAEDFATADAAFHVALLHASDNPVFSSLAGMIGQVLDTTFRATSSPGGSRAATLALHREVVAAVMARDAEVAAERMRLLIEQATDDLAQHFAKARAAR